MVVFYLFIFFFSIINYYCFVKPLNYNKKCVIVVVIVNEIYFFFTFSSNHLRHVLFTNTHTLKHKCHNEHQEQHY